MNITYRMIDVQGTSIRQWSIDGKTWFLEPAASGIKTPEPFAPAKDDPKGQKRVTRGPGSLGTPGRLVSRGGRHRKILRHSLGSSTRKKLHQHDLDMAALANSHPHCELIYLYEPAEKPARLDPAKVHTGVILTSINGRKTLRPISSGHNPPPISKQIKET